MSDDHLHLAVIFYAYMVIIEMQMMLRIVTVAVYKPAIAILTNVNEFSCWPITASGFSAETPIGQGWTNARDCRGLRAPKPTLSCVIAVFVCLQ